MIKSTKKATQPSEGKQRLCVQMSDPSLAGVEPGEAVLS
jgi:hypothetical protein